MAVKVKKAITEPQVRVVRLGVPVLMVVTEIRDKKAKQELMAQMEAKDKRVRLV